MATLVSSNPDYEVRVSVRDRACSTVINGFDPSNCDRVIKKGDEYVACIVRGEGGVWQGDKRRYCTSCALAKLKCIRAAGTVAA